MAIALGKTPEAEMMDNLHKMSSKLANEVGLLFTNKTKDFVIEYAQFLQILLNIIGDVV